MYLVLISVEPMAALTHGDLWSADGEVIGAESGNVLLLHGRLRGKFRVFPSLESLKELPRIQRWRSSEILLLFTNGRQRTKKQDNYYDCFLCFTDNCFTFKQKLHNLNKVNDCKVMTLTLNHIILIKINKINNK